MPDTATPLPKLYQLPALSAWQVQSVTLCTIGLSTMHLVLTSPFVRQVLMSQGSGPEFREYASLIRTSPPDADTAHFMQALEQISKIADQARLDTGRYK